MTASFRTTPSESRRTRGFAPVRRRCATKDGCQTSHFSSTPETAGASARARPAVCSGSAHGLRPNARAGSRLVLDAPSADDAHRRWGRRGTPAPPGTGRERARRISRASASSSRFQSEGIRRAPAASAPSPGCRRTPPSMRSPLTRSYRDVRAGRQSATSAKKLCRSPGASSGRANTTRARRIAPLPSPREPPARLPRRRLRRRRFAPRRRLDQLLGPRRRLHAARRSELPGHADVVHRGAGWPAAESAQDDFQATLARHRAMLAGDRPRMCWWGRHELARALSRLEEDTPHHPTAERVNEGPCDADTAAAALRRLARR